MAVSLEELFQSPSPWITAHRGDSHHFPENSLSAFHSAIEKGAEMIELDLRMSHDHVPIVIHDSCLDRTTNGHGPVSSMDFSQLKLLDNGSWINLNSTRSYVHSGLNENSSQSYRVRAVNGAGAGAVDSLTATAPTSCPLPTCTAGPETE